jgi:serine-threonine kinase receptor-associated protein
VVLSTIIGCQSGGYGLGRLHSVSPTFCVVDRTDVDSRIWDPSSGECLSVLSHQHIVKAVSFPIQKQPSAVATGGQEKKLRIWDLARAPPVTTEVPQGPRTPTTIAEAIEVGANDHTASIKSIVWNVDYNIITTAADDKTMRWYDLSTNNADDMDPGILSVAAGHSAIFFDASRPGQAYRQVNFDHNIASVAISPSTGRFVTGGSKDTWVRVWDLESEKQLGKRGTLSRQQALTILQIH